MGHFRVNNISGNAKLKELILDRSLLILIRDPRDIVNSMVNFLPNSPNSYHKLLSKQLDGKSYQEQIITVANGLKLENSDIEVSDIRRHCAGFVNFSSVAKTMHVIKYEDFFDGEIVEKIAEIFNIEIEVANTYVSEAMSSKTKTKRQDGGRPYGWRTEFNQEIKDFFVKEYSDVILNLGYKLY
ncbi:MAG: hypothetical protein CFE39_05445 [Comamonadaceae bacterium PBBC2]|nr:MAG: hypothetical protein CFE39_05445 [Comamonadaceae bacterium PBBC2]